MVAKAGAKAHRPALKNTSAESEADLLPPGGAYRHSLHVQGQTGTRDVGAVVPPGQAGLGVQPAGSAGLSLRTDWGWDNQRGASSLSQKQLPPPAEIAFSLGEQDGTEWLQVAASLGQICRGILMSKDIWRPGVYKSVTDLGKFLARNIF